MDARNITDQALKLGPLQRAELIETLLSSFDQKRGELDALWAAEAESRIDAHDEGEIKSSSAEDVFAGIADK
jgi:putative addiction module component (TIGR02574 family)